MITQAEEKPCVDPEVIKDLHETYKKLQDEPKNTLEHKLQYYVDKQYELDEKLRKDCPVNAQKPKVPEIVEDISPDAEIM